MEYYSNRVLQHWITIAMGHRFYAFYYSNNFIKLSIKSHVY